MSSVRIALPLMLPAALGAKSMVIEQVAPAASVNAELEPASVWVQVDASSHVKFALTLGFVPVVGSGKVSTLLPIFCTVTACGPSVLSVVPATVGVGKVRVGGIARFSSMSG